MRRRLQLALAALLLAGVGECALGGFTFTPSGCRGLSPSQCGWSVMCRSEWSGCERPSVGPRGEMHACDPVWSCEPRF